MDFLKSKTFVYVAAAVLLLATLTYLFKDEVKGIAQKLRGKAKSMDDGDLDGQIVLKMGMRSAEVLKLQQLLNQKGETLTEDGIFGMKTKAALKKVADVEQISLESFAKMFKNTIKAPVVVTPDKVNQLSEEYAESIGNHGIAATGYGYTQDA